MAKQTNRGKRSVFNEKHLQKISFENWRTTKLCWKKRTDIGTMTWNRKKINNRPILRCKIVLMILFIRSHFVIDRSCTTLKLHISSAKSTENYRVGSHKIERIICNSFHLTITDDEYYKYFYSLLYKTSGYISYVI